MFEISESGLPWVDWLSLSNPLISCHVSMEDQWFLRASMRGGMKTRQERTWYRTLQVDIRTKGKLFAFIGGQGCEIPQQVQMIHSKTQTWSGVKPVVCRGVTSLGHCPTQKIEKLLGSRMCELNPIWHPDNPEGRRNWSIPKHSKLVF